MYDELRLGQDICDWMQLDAMRQKRTMQAGWQILHLPHRWNVTSLGGNNQKKLRALGRALRSSTGDWRNHCSHTLWDQGGGWRKTCGPSESGAPWLGWLPCQWQVHEFAEQKWRATRQRCRQRAFKAGGCNACAECALDIGSLGPLLAHQ